MPSVKKLVCSLTAMMIAILLLSGTANAAASKTGIITGEVVNLRAKPDTSAKILLQLDKGTSVSVVGSEGEWYKVSYSDSTGWINDNYISIRDQSISAATVTGSVVNVRSKPNLSSEVLTQLSKGTKVDIFERSGDWYRISIGEDRFGWVNKEFLSVRSDTVSRGLTTDVAAPVPLDAATDGKTAQTTVEDTVVIDGPEGDAVESEGSEEGAVSETDKADSMRQEIVAYAKKLLGIRYVYGGSSTKGFDCSGFVSYVFEHFDVTLERASRDMGSSGTAVKKTDLQPGDLVFFDTNGGLNGINHVGIYIGSNKFIHASSSLGRKVTISSLGDRYYSGHYMRARDYLTK